MYLPFPLPFSSRFTSLRPNGAAEVRYCETSMKDCFGLSYLHKFFSVPFLQMQVGVVRGACSHCVLSCTAQARERTTCYYTISCLYVCVRISPLSSCPLARDVAAAAAGEPAAAAGKPTRWWGGAWYVSLARAGLFSLHSANNCVQSLFYVVWIATICRLCGSVNLPHFVCFIHLPHLQLTKEELEYRAESTDFNYTRLVQDDL